MRVQGRKSTGSSFKQDTFFYGTSTVAERCVSILIIPLLTKTLSQEVYGIWTQMIITAGLVSPIVLMGFPTASVQFLSGKKTMRETSSTFHGMVGIVLSNSFLVMAIAFAFSPSLSTIMFGDARFSEFVYVFGLFLTVQALFEMAIAFLRARREMRLLSLYYFLQNGGRIGILALGILLLQINLFYAIVCIVIAQLVLSIFIYIRDIRKKVGFNVAIRKTPWKEILCFSLPLIQ